MRNPLNTRNQVSLELDTEIKRRAVEDVLEELLSTLTRGDHTRAREMVLTGTGREEDDLNSRADVEFSKLSSY